MATVGKPRQGDQVRKARGLRVAAVLGLALLAPAAHAAAYAVDSTGDQADATPGNGVCATSGATPKCTLRAAIGEIEAVPFDTEQISFSIPGCTAASPCTITPATTFTWIQSIINITDFAGGGRSGPRIFIDASQLGQNPAFRVQTPTNTIAGIGIHSYAGTGIDVAGTNAAPASATIIGNWIGLSQSGVADAGGLVGIAVNGFATAVIGSGQGAIEGNIIAGNFDAGIRADGTVSLPGNNLIGTSKTGAAAVGNGVGIRLSKAGTVGPTNTISGNTSHGVLVTAGASQISGNTIGRTPDGTISLSNGGAGVRLESTGSTVGGLGQGQGNLIATNSGAGVEVAGSNSRIGPGNTISGNGAGGVAIKAGSGSTVVGNRIGRSADGSQPLPNVGAGVLVESSNNSVGGTSVPDANVIASNTGAGVAVPGAAVSGVNVRGNSMFSNGGLGVDLGPVGVTPNDPGDGDAGANKLFNAPAITSLAPQGAGTRITGTVSTTPSTPVNIEAFTNAACDPSGFGEGETFVGSASVTSNAQGTATWTVDTAAPVADKIVTATATGNGSDTSEFSGCFPTPVAPAGGGGEPAPTPAGVPAPPDGGSTGSQQPAGSRFTNATFAQPAFGKLRGRVKRDGSFGQLTVECRGDSPCTSGVAITENRTMGSAAKAKSLGSAQLAIPAGGRKTIKLSLSRSAMRALKRAGRLRLTITVTTRDAVGHVKVTTRGHKLKPPQ